ncbi:MAG: 1-deoxy-D-xylulose-5-phosphate reductoisomerase [Gammaproteobacteria bacterium]|nr:1-deoxy-D-xylulose-5-phosphate reductoisomerase [Rhodocyclaceae bacterium]MBU3908978.1 1-deoxy-D-xylulose-5-phosphate reductoisomerase [Gammaproteobacteria bacterium]MBU3989144.1 1-deoxy-D-xylulose-5-phosphate reductoisomerase [Gammaproteobacteria bacterium]MBU4005849.1 1-deoxy-D-xylulose-5-phosphate reductoisomerase [Gammaproteobacteria bacterium]MBU4021613.1 1-deoxy-D-xylulose-5-phosphate reductoisomerase [Gammaproteobacteria bacterium]
MKRQKLTVLGATGSIGVSTLDVVARHPDRYEVIALTGNSRVEVLLDQCLQHRPRYAVVGNADAVAGLTERLRSAGLNTEVLAGPAALEQVAALPEVDMVMAAIVGAAGLQPTLAAVRQGKRVLLANKEVLVMAGALFMAEVRRYGATLLPIDSEHNAVFQSLPADYAGEPAGAGVSHILLTASGGPFLGTPLERLQNVTPAEACAHPNWEMGRKISVDSATLMNKGLEVIEAHWLFNLLPEQIEVVIHPQSVIHSLVQYVDGSVLAELGNPDMRTPIAYAMAWPERIAAGVLPLDLPAIARLSFEKPDLLRFPCLALAFRALRDGANAATVLNAANEVAVAAFLAGHLPFLAIAEIIAATLDAVPVRPMADLTAILAEDANARAVATELLARKSA